MLAARNLIVYPTRRQTWVTKAYDSGLIPIKESCFYAFYSLNARSLALQWFQDSLVK